jgi:hypothetical protein
MDIGLIIIWINFIKASVFDGLFWLFPVLMIISFYYFRKFTYNRSAFFFMVVVLILMYLEPYYYFWKASGGINYRYFYQMIPLMVVIGAPAVLFLAEKLQFFSNKYSMLTKWTKGKYSLIIVLVAISAICLGFSLSQRSEIEKNFIFEPIEIINSITREARTRPIYIYEADCDQGRVPYYINAVQSNIVEKADISPEHILKICKALSFLDRNIFVYIRMSDSEFRSKYVGLGKDFKLKLLKEVIYKRNRRRTVFSLYQYEQ